MNQTTTNSNDLSIETRAKMVNTATLGGIVFVLILGLHSYRSGNTAYEITAWAGVGLIIGIVMGIVAQIPATHKNIVIRLGQAGLQGASRGALVGAVLQAMILLSQLIWIQKGYLPSHPSFVEIIGGIRSFAFCGTGVGLTFMLAALSSKNSTENDGKQKVLRFLLIGTVLLLIFLTLSTLFIVVSSFVIRN